MELLVEMTFCVLSLSVSFSTIFFYYIRILSVQRKKILFIIFF